jgi:ATPase subunit of ABC transporter with duplicated ATPase domains
MTNPWLTLDSVSHVLPDGRTLFSDLNHTLEQGPTGLVGRNGVGKSLLARILAGQVQPSSGRCLRSGSVHYLDQHVSTCADATVASLAGVDHILAAAQRIEAGSSEPADFDSVGDRWDARERLRDSLAHHGLGHLDASTPARALSGGEAVRVALIGAMLSDADFLILDEPSNHLDRAHRLALIDQLQHWTRGLLVISHDRQLLDTMTRTIELTSLGLRSYGGNYTFHAASKAQQRQHALHELERCKRERQRDAQAMRAQCERQARKQARGKRQGKEANQAKILLDRQEERSERSTGTLRTQQAAAKRELDLRVRDAAQRLENDATISLHALPTLQAARRRVAELNAVQLPHVPQRTRRIDLSLYGQQRVGVTGPNGCGKTTLLKVLAGMIAPLAGQARLCLIRSISISGSPTWTQGAMYCRSCKMPAAVRLRPTYACGWHTSIWTRGRSSFPACP